MNSFEVIILIFLTERELNPLNVSLLGLMIRAFLNSLNFSKIRKGYKMPNPKKSLIMNLFSNSLCFSEDERIDYLDHYFK